MDIVKVKEYFNRVKFFDKSSHMKDAETSIWLKRDNKLTVWFHHFPNEEDKNLKYLLYINFKSKRLIKGSSSNNFEDLMSELLLILKENKIDKV